MDKLLELIEDLGKRVENLESKIEQYDKMFESIKKKYVKTDSLGNII